MEQNLPAFTKKIMKFVRVIYFLLCKGISKSKLLFDLNRMMKRGKIASKSIHNLMFHNPHQNNNWDTNFTTNMSPQPGEYEFSCSNSPSTNYHPFSLFHKKHHSKNRKNDDLDTMAVIVNTAVLKAMEMIHSENVSPALPGFGRSPIVRQLRVTDSPFPLSSLDEDSHVVDEAAEQFINRFYNDLRRQKQC